MAFNYPKLGHLVRRLHAEGQDFVDKVCGIVLMSTTDTAAVLLWQCKSYCSGLSLLFHATLSVIQTSPVCSWQLLFHGLMRHVSLRSCRRLGNFSTLEFVAFRKVHSHLGHVPLVCNYSKLECL